MYVTIKCVGPLLSRALTFFHKLRPMAFKDFQDARKEISYHEFMQLPVAVNLEMADSWWDVNDRPISFLTYYNEQNWISKHFAEIWPGEFHCEYGLHIEKEKMRSSDLEYLEMHLYLWLYDNVCI